MINLHAKILLIKNKKTNSDSEVARIYKEEVPIYDEKDRLVKDKIELLLNGRKFLEAIPLLEQLIANGIRDPHIYFDLGWVYRDCGKFSEAEAVLKKGLELFPQEDDLYQKLGNCLLSRKVYKEAMIYSKKALELNPSNKVALDELASAYISTDKYDEEIESILEKKIFLLYWFSKSITPICSIRVMICGN